MPRLSDTEWGWEPTFGYRVYGRQFQNEPRHHMQNTTEALFDYYHKAVRGNPRIDPDILKFVDRIMREWEIAMHERNAARRERVAPASVPPSVSSMQRMEADIGKLREAIGTLEFNRILGIPNPEPRTSTQNVVVRR